MIKKINILATLFILICLLSKTAIAGDHETSYSEDHLHLMLKLAGTGSMYKRAVPGYEEEAMCFDIDLVDMKNGETIGTATDCLSDVQPKGDGMSIVGTTLLNMPEGSFVIRGNISAQPVLEETILESGQIITHITGASSTENSILGGTGIYEYSSGNVRLSGLVDMANFDANEGDLVVFDCLLYIHLNLNQ
jgi:hypothetical protein